MNRNLLAIAVTMIAVFAVASPAADDPFVGTWKLNMREILSQRRPASTTPDSVLLLQNGTFQCLSCDPRISIKADGTDQAVPLQKPYEYDMMATKVVDDKTIESIAKKEGQVLYTARTTVSADGKTSTIEIVYPDASKQPSIKLTYDRVAEAPPGAHAVSGTWRRHTIDVSGNANQPANEPTLTFKSSPDGLILSGRLIGGPSDAKVDGKDHPGMGAVPGETVSLSRVNERTIDQINKRDGKIVSVTHLTVSEDGKTMTIKLESQTQAGTGLTFTAIKE